MFLQRKHTQADTARTFTSVLITNQETMPKTTVLRDFTITIIVYFAAPIKSTMWI